MDLFLVIRLIAYITVCYFAIKKKSQTIWIFAAMMIGAEFGHQFPDISKNLKVLSSIFLKLIKCIIAPLLFSTLVVGIAGHSNIKQIGRMGWKSLVYFEIVTTIALFIGLAAINITGAGKGINISAITTSTEAPKVEKQTASDIILHIFPENIAKSVADGQVLQIVIFSILFGIGLAMIKDEKKKKPILEFCESLSEVMFKFTHVIMYYAPIGVGAAIAYTVGNLGLDILNNLLQLLATLYGALIVFVLVVFVPVGLIIGLPFKKFIKAISEPVTLAFATTSSEAALPSAMEAVESIGVPRKIIAFVMPTGYSFNLDGTTLYLSLASVFVAQAAHIDLSFNEQLLMVFTLMLTSKGVAGVPRASMVILLGSVAAFDLPPEPVFVIMGVDALMDMARTAVNVIGNCLASVVVAKWEGEFHPTKD